MISTQHLIKTIKKTIRINKTIVVLSGLIFANMLFPLESYSAISITKIGIYDSSGNSRTSFMSNEFIKFSVECTKDTSITSINFEFTVKDANGVEVFKHTGNAFSGPSTTGGASIERIPISRFFRSGITNYTFTAKITGGAETATQNMSFTVREMGASSQLSLITPVDNAEITSEPINFTWQSIGASKYRITISESQQTTDTGQGMFIQKEVTQPNYQYPETNINYELYPRQKLQSGKTYWWKVESVDDSGEYTISSVWRKFIYRRRKCNIYIDYYRSIINFEAKEQFEFKATVLSEENSPMPINQLKLNLQYRLRGQSTWNKLKDSFTTDTMGKVSGKWFPHKEGEYEWKLTVSDGEKYYGQSIVLSAQAVTGIEMSDYAKAFSISYSPVKQYYKVNDVINVKVNYAPNDKILFFQRDKRLPIFVCIYYGSEKEKARLVGLRVLDSEPYTFDYELWWGTGGGFWFEVGVNPTQEMYEYAEFIKRSGNSRIPILDDIKSLLDNKEASNKRASISRYLRDNRQKHIVAVSYPPVVVYSHRSEPHFITIPFTVNGRNFNLNVRCNDKDIVEKSFAINIDPKDNIQVISGAPLKFRIPISIYNKSYWMWVFEGNSIKDGHIKYGTMSNITDWDKKLYGGESVTFYLELELNGEASFSATRPTDGTSPNGIAISLMGPAFLGKTVIKTEIVKYLNSLGALNESRGKSLLQFLKLIPSFRTVIKPRRDVRDTLIDVIKEVLRKELAKSLGDLAADDISDEVTKWFIEKITTEGYSVMAETLEKKTWEAIVTGRYENNISKEDVHKFVVNFSKKYPSSFFEKIEESEFDSIPFLSTMAEGIDLVGWSIENWATYPSFSYFYISINKSQ